MTQNFAVRAWLYDLLEELGVHVKPEWLEDQAEDLIALVKHHEQRTVVAWSLAHDEEGLNGFVTGDPEKAQGWRDELKRRGIGDDANSVLPLTIEKRNTK